MARRRFRSDKRRRRQRRRQRIEEHQLIDWVEGQLRKPAFRDGKYVVVSRPAPGEAFLVHRETGRHTTITFPASLSSAMPVGAIVDITGSNIVTSGAQPTFSMGTMVPHDP